MISAPLRLGREANYYAYAQGAPVRYADPSGLLTIAVGGGVQVAGGVAGTTASGQYHDEGGVYYNTDSGETGGYATTGADRPIVGDADAGYGGILGSIGGSIAFIKGDINQFCGDFKNFQVNFILFSVTAYFSPADNGDDKFVGVGFGYGPGFGAGVTRTNTIVQPVNGK